MPRIGKKPIILPAGVTVTVTGQEVTVKGPKGTLQQHFHPAVKFDIQSGQVLVDVLDSEEKKSRELWGLWRVLVANMVEGVTQGYSKQLEINGVGYRAAAANKKLTLQVGYSHPVEYSFPAGIEMKVEKNIITITGIDKQLVGQVAAEIRDVRPPEPYKGKGIRYIGEAVRRKAGKVAKTVGAA